MAKEKWMIKNKKADFAAICKEFKVTEVISRLLINRDLEHFDKIKKYLYPELSDLYSGDLLKDLSKTCDILMKKIENRKKIRIIGDYDVDGVISTYVLLRTFYDLDAKIDFQIPDRIKDGYGINIQMIKKAYEDGIDTIITCDNGISAKDQIEYAKHFNMTVLITDHHDIPEELPKADAIINPKQVDCPYPYKGLCGAGVVYKLIKELYKRVGMIDKADEYLEYIAIATVCDVMELTDENRIIVKYGLQQLRDTKNYGLLALMEATKIEPKNLSAYHLGYIIGPCLNATGRLETAERGISLLMAKSKEVAIELAQELFHLNAIRKDMTVKGLEMAMERIETEGLNKDKVFVIYLPTCHESLAGIIAGRIREYYNKPAIVLTKGEEHVKGSGRSIECYSMYEELTKCKDYLIKFGGHPMAAGLSLLEEQIEPFRLAMNENCSLNEEDFIPKVSIDVVLALSGLSESLVRELELLEPFGKGNEKPIFAEKDLLILKVSILGKGNKVIKLSVMDRYGKIMDAMYFGDAERFINELKEKYKEETVKYLLQGRAKDATISVTYYPSINEYNGSRTLQIVIQNYMF